jgi:oligosaccharide repeat unit polymerase
MNPERMLRFDSNIDKIILFVIPILIPIIYIFTWDELGLLASLVLSMIWIYELITYKNRDIYGFSGILILSPPSIIILTYSILISIPSIFLTYNASHHAKYIYYISILSFYILFPAGLLSAKYFFPIDHQKIKQLKVPGFSKSKYEYLFFEILVLLLVIALPMVILYFIRVDKIPLFELIKDPGAYFRLNELRDLSMKLLKVSFIEKYMFAWLRDIIFPFGIISSLFLYINNKKSNYLILLGIYLVVGLFYNSLTIAKAPVATIFLGIAAVYFLKKQIISIKFIFITILLIFLFPYVILYSVTLPQYRDPLNLFNSILLRIFSVPGEALFEYFKIFPYMHEHLDGRTSNFFAWLHPQGLFNITNYVAKIWWRLPQTTGSANAVFIGNFWADFGLIGVIVASVTIGFIIHYFYYNILIISAYRKDIIYTTILSITLMSFSFTFVSTSFTTILITRGVLLLLFILIVIRKTKYFRFS